jgi:hypothetical protein
VRFILIIEQRLDINGTTMVQAYHVLRDGLFPISEILLEVGDERGHGITEQWRVESAEMQE